MGFDGGCDINGFGKVGFRHFQVLDVGKETGLSQKLFDSGVAVILDFAHDIGGHTHLDAVEIGFGEKGIQGMGNQVLTAAGGSAVFSDLHGNAAHG